MLHTMSIKVSLKLQEPTYSTIPTIHNFCIHDNSFNTDSV